MDIISQKSKALKTIEFKKDNLVLGIVSLFTIFFTEMSAQPFIRTSGGLGQYGYIEKNAAATNFLVANGGYGNIYQYGVRSYINGSTNNYAYTGSGSCARGDDATGNYSFGSGTLNTGSTVYSSVFVEYCGPSYSCGSMTPTVTCFNERSFFVMDFVPKTDALVSSACYTTTNTNVVMTFTIDNNNTSGQSLNRLWLVNDGTALENTDINTANDAFRVYYEPATGSEVFDGNESSQPLYGNYGGNATNNNEYGSDALGISVPQNTTGGLRCYVVLQGTSTYLNSSAKTKTIRMAVIADGINITPNRDTSYSKMVMDLTRPSSSYITINDIVTPTFSGVSPICTGESLSALPTTSTNGIVGTWSPALDNTTTTIYTFTPNAGQCASTTTLTITVNPNNTVGTASSTPTLCINTALTAITHATTGATGIGTVTGLPTGVTAAWASNTITISGTPTTSGVFNYSILLTGGCGSINATGSITVNPESTGGSVSSSQTICSGTTPANLTLSGHTGAVGKWQSSTNVGFLSPTDISNTSITLTGAMIGNLTANTYFRAVVQSGVCTSANSSAVLITVDAVSVGGTVSSDQTICSGTEPENLTLSGHTGGVIKWQSSSNVGFTSPTDIAETSNTLDGVIIGTLISDTYFRAVVQSGICPVAYSASVLITVDSLTVGGTVSSIQTICSGSQPSDLTLTGHTGSVIKWESSLDVGFTSPTDIIVTSATLTGATIGSLTQDTYFRAVLQNGACNVEESSAVLISVDDAPVGGSVGGGTAICAGSTSGLLTLSSYTGTINRWEYSVSPFTSWTTISNTIATYTSGALTQTTQFRAVIQNGVCPEAFSVATSVDIETTTWNGTAWDNGNPVASFPEGYPSYLTAVIPTGTTFTSGGFNINACSLTVASGATVVISSGDTVTLSGLLTANVGSFVTFNNNANLIQSGSTNSNSGAIIIKKNSSFLKRLDYTLWSSPVANQQLKAFSPGTLDNRFYTYNTQTIVSPATAANIYVTVPSPSTTNFDTAKGYLIRVPNTHSTTGAIWTGSFTGKPNNGNYSYTLVDGGAGERFNLVGNPYPSPIDAVAFVNNSTNFANTTATLYFWRKTNNSANPSYSSWNEGVGYLNPNGEASEANFFLNQVINVGQGFFVEASGSGTLLDFDNSMRINNHDNQFFKSSQATTTSTERNRIWLKAFNSLGLTTQTLLGYVTNATLSVDQGIDGRDINDGDLGLSTLIGTVSYAIQGRPVPFDASDIVPLNFKATTAGDYMIAIEHADGLFSGGAQSVYLKDNLISTIHNLNTGAYSFASEAGTFNNRFEIVYALPLGTDNPIFSANNVIIYNQNNELIINSGNIIMASIKVFDIRGRLLQERKEINASHTTIGSGLANEVLLVQITSIEGVVVTKKVVR